MVMNLDKCIGCHTCSVTCKQAWTNRAGTEYVWFNNVETRPGPGLPAHLRGPGEVEGRLGAEPRAAGCGCGPAAGCQAADDLRQPAACRRSRTTTSPGPTTTTGCSPRPAQEHTPGRPAPLAASPARPRDHLERELGRQPRRRARAHAGRPGAAARCRTRSSSSSSRPSCSTCRASASTASTRRASASCPSGAMYKRAEDGIVLVDQDRCRGWRMCVTGCPYKKVYFNHRTGKAEKCTFCFPRVEVGHARRSARRPASAGCATSGWCCTTPTGCCEAAATPDEKDLLDAQRAVFLDPHDPEVIAAARAAGIPQDWLEAARRSPVYALIVEYKVALPLHPEYRTMPMVWYIPPLSPVVDALTRDRARRRGRRQPVRRHRRAAHPGGVPGRAVHRRRHRAGRGVLRKLAAMRSYMRDINLGDEPDESIAAGGRHDRASDIQEMYRLLAIAKYEERYVIPPAHAEQGTRLEELGHRVLARLRGRPRHGRWGRSARRPAASRRSRWRTSTCSQDRQTCGTLADRPDDQRGRVNLLNWDGKGRPEGLFPPKRASGGTAGPGRVMSRRTARRTGAARASPARSASLLLGYPDERLLPGLPGAPRGGRGARRRAAAGPLAAFLDHLDATPLAELPAALRGDLRPAAALLPVPHLLHLRRHPQARHGAADGSSTRSARPGSRSPTASCPTTSPWCCEFVAAAAPCARRAACCASTAPGLELLLRGPGGGGSPYAHVVAAVSPPCRRSASATARP